MIRLVGRATLMGMLVVAMLSPIALAEATPEPEPVRLLEDPDVAFYVDPDSNGHRQAAGWEATRPEDAALMERLGDQPSADWFGDWTTDPEGEIGHRVTTIADAGALPVMVFYTIPYRDCGLYSAGGANDPATYRAWIEAATRGIGNRPAVVILEPDALAGMDCLTVDQVEERYALLGFAVDALQALPNADVYIDAGNAAWHPAGVMAGRLQSAGIDRATGFALNVSNFHTTEVTTNYGHAISDTLGDVDGTPFVIDTSRNGNGPWQSSDPESWCNPPGRALGATPTTDTGDVLVDAWLWIKTPGESDGECRGAPPAGVWYPEYALELARNAWGDEATGTPSGSSWSGGRRV